MRQTAGVHDDANVLPLGRVVDERPRTERRHDDAGRRAGSAAVAHRHPLLGKTGCNDETERRGGGATHCVVHGVFLAPTVAAFATHVS